MSTVNRPVPRFLHEHRRRRLLKRSAKLFLVMIVSLTIITSILAFCTAAVNEAREGYRASLKLRLPD